MIAPGLAYHSTDVGVVDLVVRTETPDWKMVGFDSMEGKTLDSVH